VTEKEYQDACAKRRDIISVNASRKLRGKPADRLPPLPVPSKTERPLVPILYSNNGTDFEGRVDDVEEANELARVNGWVIKMESVV